MFSQWTRFDIDTLIRLAFFTQLKKYSNPINPLFHGGHLMQAVLELPGPGLLHLGPPLILGHLCPLLAHHLLQVVDLVLELMLLVPLSTVIHFTVGENHIV